MAAAFPNTLNGLGLGRPPDPGSRGIASARRLRRWPPTAWRALSVCTLSDRPGSATRHSNADSPIRPYRVVNQADIVEELPPGKHYKHVGEKWVIHRSGMIGRDAESMENA